MNLCWYILTKERKIIFKTIMEGHYYAKSLLQKLEIKGKN